jgi:hypothetical protein
MNAGADVDQQELVATLSVARFSTYLAAAGNDPAHGLALYAWHARIASALMLPAHFAEVAIRNAVSEAVTEAYGERWPWSPGFERSLPDSAQGYSPSRDLRDARRHWQSTGKVVADLKFVFWQKMFTSRHDERLWKPRIFTVLPNAPVGTSHSRLRSQVYDDLEVVRRLRNRLAHHEPVFTRDLRADLARMMDLIQLRSQATSDWVRNMETVTTLLQERPLPPAPAP